MVITINGDGDGGDDGHDDSDGGGDGDIVDGTKEIL